MTNIKYHMYLFLISSSPSYASIAKTLAPWILPEMSSLGDAVREMHESSPALILFRVFFPQVSKYFKNLTVEKFCSARIIVQTHSVVTFITSDRKARSQLWKLEMFIFFRFFFFFLFH